MATPLPIRERILRKIVANLEKVQEGDDEHVITWNLVTRDPWEDVEQLMSDTIGVFDMTEQSFDEQGFVRKRLEVATEFWLKPKLGDNNAELINVVMGDVNKTMRADPTLITDIGPPVCQLAIDLVEVSSEVELEREDLVGGVIIWNIIYRHDQDDPGRLYGQVP